jgi:hypothetical protein
MRSHQPFEYDPDPEDNKKAAPVPPPPQPTGLCWAYLDAWKRWARSINPLMLPAYPPVVQSLAERLDNPHTYKPEVDQTLMLAVEWAENLPPQLAGLVSSELLEFTKKYLKGE